MPRLPLSSRNVLDMTYSAQQARLATLHTDDTIRIWAHAPSTRTWAFSLALKVGHAASTARSMAWAPSAALLASAGGDGKVVLTAVPAAGGGAATLVLGDARKALSWVAFSGASGMLASFGDEGVVRIYKGEGGGGIGEWFCLARVHVGVFGGGLSFGSGKALCAGGVVVVRGRTEWDWDVWAEVGDGAIGGRKGVKAVTCVDWGCEGLLAAGREDGVVEVWDMGGEADANVGVLDAEAEEEETGLSDGIAAVKKVEWDLAGSLVAVAHVDGVVRMWGRNAVENADGSAQWPWRIRNTVRPADADENGDAAEAGSWFGSGEEATMQM